ncbi:MAG TPA: toll/interleukin-1 receptor domain-containing protein [Aggregatilineales bacterium]|nr:toll/interleukin-1 receptor domain-containing protein [Aggregatilineales bacterium]
MTAPDPSTPYDLFVSHATADDAIVSQIADRLKAAGLRAWIDHERGITYGDNWDRAIHDAANACTAGLFILSPASTKSEYCIAEWNRILALGKRLYIAMITPVPVPDIPLRLGTIQYADLTRDRDGVLPTLIEAIVAQRGLDPNDANVGQARAIAGSFPRWQLDLPLIGREADLKQVRDLLAGPNRAVVILGLGGVGKTRLAAEIAATADPAQFRDGVLWHTITDAPSDFATLTGLIRDHLGLDKTT